MAAEYMKKTQSTLGKIIKKPPLTDKLLGKPPFRFLHDVFTEVIRTTGFLNGLFSSTEMDSKNVSVKEDKIAFLQKVIDVVTIVSGEQLSVRPSKIVAGHEPEKTNELLQAIAKCIHKNVSSDDAVQQVLSGKKPSSKVQEKPPAGPSKRKEGKENREKPDDQRKKKRDREDDKRERERSSDRRRRSASKDGRDRSRDKEGNREQGAGEGSEEREREHSREKPWDKERNKEDRSRDRREDRRERKESRSKIKDSGSHSKKNLERKSSSKTLQKSPEKKTTSTTKQKRPQPNGPDSERRRKKPSPKREEEPQEKEEQDSGKRERDAEEDEERPSRENQEEKKEEGNEKPGSSRPPRPASAKGHRRRPAPDKGSRGNAPDGQEASPKETSRSRPARPPSARPAAPRVRQRPDAAEEEIARMESAGRHRTAPIIVDRGSRPSGEGLSSSDDEDEQFLVQEEDVQPPEMGKLSPLMNGEVNGEEEEGEHGGLVRKILETKKELETVAAKGANVTGKKRTEIERAPVNEVQRRKEREVVMRDIEKLRTSVQKLCRSAVPLGKIIDYIQEDMDSMQNELLQWKRENKEHAARLKEEESITTKTIEPLQAELDELDRSIAAQVDMIAASKCNVIKNQEKIDKMVSGVTARS